MILKDCLEKGTIVPRNLSNIPGLFQLTWTLLSMNVCHQQKSVPISANIKINTSNKQSPLFSIENHSNLFLKKADKRSIDRIVYPKIFSIESRIFPIDLFSHFHRDDMKLKWHAKDIHRKKCLGWGFFCCSTIVTIASTLLTTTMNSFFVDACHFGQSGVIRLEGIK